MTFSIEKIYEEFNNSLKRFINRRVQNEEDVKDILHDIFLKIHNNINNLKDTKKLKAWIYKISNNAVVDYYRSPKFTQELKDIPDTKGSKNNSDTNKEIASYLKKVLIDRLPKKYKQAIILAELKGLTQKETAEKLGLSIPGAKSRIQRAKKKLKEMLLECCDFEFDRFGNILEYKEKKKKNNFCILF